MLPVRLAMLPKGTDSLPSLEAVLEKVDLISRKVFAGSTHVHQQLRVREGGSRRRGVGVEEVDSEELEEISREDQEIEQSWPQYMNSQPSCKVSQFFKFFFFFLRNACGE